jgi:hypothetical protein
MFAFPAVPIVTTTLIEAVLVKFRETALIVETLLPETRTVFAALFACSNAELARSNAAFA